jgi:hypothetical protein
MFFGASSRPCRRRSQSVPLSKDYEEQTKCADVEDDMRMDQAFVGVKVSHKLDSRTTKQRLDASMNCISQAEFYLRSIYSISTDVIHKCLLADSQHRLEPSACRFLFPRPDFDHMATGSSEAFREYSDAYLSSPTT